MPTEMQSSLARLIGEWAAGSNATLPNGTTGLHIHRVTTAKGMLPKREGRWEEATMKYWDLI